MPRVADFLAFGLYGFCGRQLYNHKRPHQGIGGLCPADRFFEIAHELRQTIEKGVEDNALELALRGRPVDPFYMVGRMGGKSVVIRAEKGKVRMLLEGNGGCEKELVYDARKDIDHEYEQSTSQGLRPATENNGGAVGLEREADDRAALSGDGYQPGAVGPVAEPGHRGDVAGAGPQAEGTPSADQPPAVAVDREEAFRLNGEAGEATAGDPEEQGGDHPLTRDGGDERAGGEASSRGDHEGALRAIDGKAGSLPVGSVPQDLLQVGGAGPFGAAVEPYGSARRPALPSGGLGETEAGAAVGTCPPGQCHFAAQDGATEGADRLEVEARYQPGGKKMSASSEYLP